MSSFYTVTDNDVAQFERAGFLLVENLYDSEEIELLSAIGRADGEKAELVHSAVDTKGGESKLWLTSDIDREDIYNGFCHGRRIVDTMERLLADEVYLYHYKMMEKEPRVGGAWEWHQDYGYWYNNGCLFPHMASCFVAIDPCHRGNDKAGHPSCRPLEKWDDSRLLELGRRQWQELQHA